MSNIPVNSKGGNVAVILIVLAVIVAAFLLLSKFFKFGDWIGGGIDTAKEVVSDTVDWVLETTNVQDTKSEAAIRKIIADEQARASTSTSPFSPLYYKSAPSSATLVTRASADRIAKQIWDSVGTISDDPEQGLAAFKQLSAKSSVSWIAEVFNQNYKRDLFSWLKLKYDTDFQREILAQIIIYVNSLKPY